MCHVLQRVPNKVNNFFLIDQRKSSTRSLLDFNQTRFIMQINNNLELQVCISKPKPYHMLSMKQLTIIIALDTT
jgi:hypothetical protein